MFTTPTLRMIPGDHIYNDSRTRNPHLIFFLYINEMSISSDEGAVVGLLPEQNLTIFFLLFLYFASRISSVQDHFSLCGGKTKNQVSEYNRSRSLMTLWSFFLGENRRSKKRNYIRIVGPAIKYRKTSVSRLTSRISSLGRLHLHAEAPLVLLSVDMERTWCSAPYANDKLAGVRKCGMADLMLEDLLSVVPGEKYFSPL